MQDGLSGNTSPLDNKVHQAICGTEAFANSVQAKLLKSDKLKEFPRRQRQLVRPPLSELMPMPGEMNKQQRNDGICKAHFDHGYHLKEIADHLGLHSATVSRIAAQKKKMLDLET